MALVSARTQSTLSEAQPAQVPAQASRRAGLTKLSWTRVNAHQNAQCSRYKDKRNNRTGERNDDPCYVESHSTVSVHLCPPTLYDDNRTDLGGLTTIPFLASRPPSPYHNGCVLEPAEAHLFLLNACPAVPRGSSCSSRGPRGQQLRPFRLIPPTAFRPLPPR